MQSVTPVQPTRDEIDRITLITQGHVAFQMLWSGHTLGLFEYLSRSPGAALPDIASELDLQSMPARVLLTGLTALGLLEHRGDGFHNGAAVESLVIRGGLADILGWQRHIVYPGLEDFESALRQDRNTGLERFAGEGETLYQRLDASPFLAGVFHDAMSSLSSHANAALLDRLNLDGVKHLVDVGGGDGTNAIALARRFPGLRLTVFDRKVACELAKKNAAAAGLGDRISTWCGDLFEDALPTDADAFLFSHIFTIWSEEKNVTILRKVRAALPSGGRVIIFNMMGNDTEAPPVSTSLGSAYFLAIATGEGMLYAWEDYERWFAETEFHIAQKQDDLPLDHGLIVGVK